MWSIPFSFHAASGAGAALSPSLPWPCTFLANPGRERGRVANPSLEQMASSSVTQLVGPTRAQP